MAAAAAAERAFQPLKDAGEGGTKALRLREHVCKAAGQALGKVAAHIPQAVGNGTDALAQQAVDLLDQVLAEVVNELLCLRGKAVVQGGQHPFAHALPVLFLDRVHQRAEGTHHALVGLVLPAFDEAVKAVGRGFLDLLGDLRDTIGGNGLDPLHRDQRPVHDVVVGLGDDLLLGRGFVGQGLGDRLGAGGNAVNHGIRCRRNGLGYSGSDLFIGLLGLGRGLAVVGDILGDSLVVFHHAVHHLLAGFGHGAGQPVILLAALAQVLGELGGLDGHLAQGVGGVGVACVLQGPQQGLGGLCGGFGLFGRLGGGVPGLGIGRDDHLRHGLGAVGHVGVGVRPDGGPVVPAGGFSNGGTGGGCDGSCTNRTAFAGEAVDEALDQVLAPLHGLRGQALDPVQVRWKIRP